MVHRYLRGELEVAESNVPLMAASDNSGRPIHSNDRADNEECLLVELASL